MATGIKTAVKKTPSGKATLKPTSKKVAQTKGLKRASSSGGLASKKPSSKEKVAVKMPERKTAGKEPSESYLTKRILVRAASTGFLKASENTMRVMGYTVVSQQGWVVRKHSDGRIEKISKIKAAKAKPLSKNGRFR